MVTRHHGNVVEQLLPAALTHHHHLISALTLPSPLPPSLPLALAPQIIPLLPTDRSPGPPAFAAFWRVEPCVHTERRRDPPVNARRHD